MGIVDEVIPEPLGGAHRDPSRTAISVKEAILRNLDEITGTSKVNLLKARYEKFRNIGIIEE